MKPYSFHYTKHCHKALETNGAQTGPNVFNFTFSYINVTLLLDSTKIYMVVCK